MYFHICPRYMRTNPKYAKFRTSKVGERPSTAVRASSYSQSSGKGISEAVRARNLRSLVGRVARYALLPKAWSFKCRATRVKLGGFVGRDTGSISLVGW